MALASTCPTCYRYLRDKSRQTMGKEACKRRENGWTHIQLAAPPAQSLQESYAPDAQSRFTSNRQGQSLPSPWPPPPAPKAAGGRRTGTAAAELGR